MKRHAGRPCSARTCVAMKLLCIALGLGLGFSGLGTKAQVAANSKAVQRTFVSRDGSFRFKYPDWLIVCGKNTPKEACLTYMPICDDNAAACVTYATARYEGYNFEGAAFSVNELPQARTQSECVGSMPPPVHTESVNGVEFSASHQSSAGMGHGLSEHSYRTFHRGKCYELAIRIATASLGGYLPGAIKEFTREDEQAVWENLEKVMSSFTFSK